MPESKDEKKLSKEETTRLLDHMSNRKKDSLVTSMMVNVDIHERNAEYMKDMFDILKPLGVADEDFLDKIQDALMKSPSDVHVERGNIAEIGGIVAKDVTIIEMEQSCRVAIDNLSHGLRTYGRCLDSCDHVSDNTRPCSCGFAMWQPKQKESKSAT